MRILNIVSSPARSHTESLKPFDLITAADPDLETQEIDLIWLTACRESL